MQAVFLSFRDLPTRNLLTTLLPPTTNESSRLVGGFLPSSTLDTGPNNPQRVVMTRWGLFSLPLASLGPSSHQQLVGGFQPSSTLDAGPNKSLRLVGGSLVPSTRFPGPLQPPTSREDSLVASFSLPPSTPAPTSHYDSLAATVTTTPSPNDDRCVTTSRFCHHLFLHHQQPVPPSPQRRRR